MKTKYILHRRPFNPSEKERDIKVLVASFGRTAQSEAKFCLAALQKCATDLKTETEFSRYRYTLYTVPDPIDLNRSGELTLDTSKARRTGRAITYDLTWDLRHGVCHMLAYHKLYGSVRAEVADTIEARQSFCRQLKRIWPNATLTRK